MAAARVAIVCRDRSLRLDAARAFDDAPPEWSVDLYEDVPGQVDVVVGTEPGPSIDVVFDPSQPGLVVAAVKGALATRGLTLLVTSACGGAGVTTLAIHLAAALSTRERACYVDLDPYLGGAARLGMPPDVRIFDPAAELLTVPHAGGFRGLFAPIEPESALAAAMKAFATCVVDMPAHRTDEVMLAPAAMVVVVVPPTLPGVARTRDFLARHDGDDWLLVANRTGPGGEATRSTLERELGRRFDLMLPCSALLRDREDGGALLTTSFSRWKRAFDRLVAGLPL